MVTTSPRWQTLPCDDAAATSLAAALGVAPLVGRLLCQRGLTEADAAARFLNPSLDQLHDPMALADMGIQQKLHTKLVQKLILTPSLQQAIKLLPIDRKSVV